MSNITALASQYELLRITSSYLSAVDLLNLASTCSALYDQIRKNETIFEQLKRVTVCDGRGLEARQKFQGLYSIPPREYYSRTADWDEEVEVRVWNLKCDAGNSLPCINCNVNICDECRYVPRVHEGYHDSSPRRPHMNIYSWCQNILCYCKECDRNIESGLPLRISKFCDCDKYMRWMCIKCREEEQTLDILYRREKTKDDFGEDVIEEGILLMHHQYDLAFWCPCGARAPSDCNVRCSWCFRRHRGRDRYWLDEDTSAPFFDNDPCCPKPVVEYNLETGVYPPLAYSDIGPITP